MSILFVYSPSVRPHGYIFQALTCVGGVDCIRDSQYENFDDTKYDGLIYSPIAFECEWNELEEKYRKAYPYIEKNDEKYLNFKGKKLLYDTRDEGNSDGFGRFKDHTSSRMKMNPGYDFMTKFNVIIPIPWTCNKGFFSTEEDVKSIPLLYCSRINGYPHRIRRIVFDRLKAFSPYTMRNGFGEYQKILRSAKVAVSVPGWGTGCKSHGETLAAKVLLFAYESVRSVKILPFSDLIDGQDYVSFNLDNLEDKLSHILNDEKLMTEISANGNAKFKVGYLPEKTGKQISEYFKGLA